MSLAGAIVRCVAVLAAAAAVTRGDTSYSRADLLERAPFGTVGSRSRAASGSYELRGFFGAGDDLEVSLRRPDTGSSRWLRVGEEGTPRVEAADIVKGTAVIVENGIRMTLRLARESGLPFSDDDEPEKSFPTHPESKRIATRLVAEEKSAREAAFAELKNDHPEYFEEMNAMNPEQRRLATNAFRQVDRRLAARYAVIAEDADDGAREIR